ncbi:hypothetical protein OG204_11775 [Streptomyces sp. NBC_01387]|uniref:hypothetical protein n=1 Tax=unclassified Streptomyces TaxID=2593676 RepID=UPI0020247E36|nr:MULTISPECIES: hypothetical protein [unclassified Streptomyces]MCX4551075.1 hypothetical protein [Streptomyces sp. NBC_01500]WSC22484.1 hypothetical protein OIE60_23950 [Streptomyces sp. NBC_01766]WSV56326.1 hypothetical protein OG282_23020 [Streptomyces sp. NBC_01014]
MVASAQLLLSALCKPVTETVPELLPVQMSDPDASTSSMELPLTSEPPLSDVAPLTSEPPLADATPLTSEPTAYGTAAGI